MIEHVKGAHWAERAACRDVPTDLFFPDGYQARRFQAQIQEAKAVCADCPVRAECLTDVLALSVDRDSNGVYAGLTPDERRDLRTYAKGATK